MDMQKLKSAAESIELSADAEKRITENCLAQFSKEQEVPPMKKHMKHSLLIGAVTGTEYENATEEIIVSLSAEGSELLVETTFVNPDVPPYNCSEMLSIGAYQILNEADKVVLEGTETPSAAVAEGQAVFYFLLDDLEKGTYTLKIDSFISSKKADQPLPVYGSWCIDFTL